MNPSVLFIDSTHIKANANKQKYKKKLVRRAAQHYKDELDQEVNEDRILHEKKPFIPETKSVEERQIKESTTDPESGYYLNGEREKQFAYSCHTHCNRHGFVLGMIATPGNVQDSVVLPSLLQTVMEHFGKPFAIVANAAYKTIPIAHRLREQDILAVFPYTRPGGVKGMLKKKDFFYDEYYDCYLCENNQILRYRTTTRDGYREYVSDPRICEACLLLSQCAKSRDHRKVILRHLWQEAMDEVEHLRHTDVNRALYRKRQETIIRVFTDAKEKHSMHWTRYRGVKKRRFKRCLLSLR